MAVSEITHIPSTIDAGHVQLGVHAFGDKGPLFLTAIEVKGMQGPVVGPDIDN